MKRKRQPCRIAAAALAILGLAAGGALVAATVNVVNGIQYRDASGTVVHAHGGGMLKVGSFYYWLVGRIHAGERYDRRDGGVVTNRAEERRHAIATVLLEIGREALHRSSGAQHDLVHDETAGERVAAVAGSAHRQRIERREREAVRVAIVASGERLSPRRREVETPVIRIVVDLDVDAVTVAARTCSTIRSRVASTRLAGSGQTGSFRMDHPRITATAAASSRSARRAVCTS